VFSEGLANTNFVVFDLTPSETFKLLIWMLLFGFYNFGHSSKKVVSNGNIFFISKLSCSDNILIE
jgi:hypothetical protein